MRAWEGFWDGAAEPLALQRGEQLRGDAAAVPVPSSPKSLLVLQLFPFSCVRQGCGLGIRARTP